MSEKTMSENETETPKRKRSLFWKNIGILCAGVSTAIFIAMLLLVSYTMLAVNSHFANTISGIANNVNESKNKIAEIQKIAMNAEQSVQQNNQAINAQAQVIEELRKEQKTNKDDYLVNEAYFLIKLANDSLQYESNIPLAIKLVQSADQDIAKITDPKMTPVRQALAADLAALQSAPQVDVTGLYARLSALSEQVDKLPLMIQLLNKPAETAANINNENVIWWRRGLNSIKEALLRIVIVRKNVPNAPPFIAPDQQIFLYQNLHTELEKAQWGLLHRQQDIYRLSLLQTANWIKQYAAENTAKTQVLQNLSQLQLMDIHPSVPNLNNSLRALQNYTIV